MIVRCVINNVAKIKEVKIRERLFESIHIDGPISDLSIGSIYPVIGIIQSDDGGIWVCLHTIEEFDYPYIYPIELFEIVDDSLLSSWAINFKSTAEGFVVDQIGFPDWVSDNFYEKLLDDDESAIAKYRSQQIYLREMTKLQFDLKNR